MFDQDEIDKMREAIGGSLFQPPPEQPPTFEEFRDSAFQGIEQNRLNLQPDEDWLPTLILDSPDGVMVMPLLLEDGQELFGQDGIRVVTSVIVSVKARMAARVQMGWAAKAVKGDMRRPGERPDKSEVLILQVAEAGRQEVWMTEVARQDGPPELGEWELASAGGPLADALASAVDLAAQA